MSTLNIIEAFACECPGFIAKRRGTAAQRQGLRYEKSVVSHLQPLYPAMSFGVWYCYRTAEAPRRTQYAQLDGLYIPPLSDRPLIAEIKKAHTPDAFFQLAKYNAILRAARPDLKPAVELEICMFVDPTLATPWAWRPVSSLDAATVGAVNVWRLRPEKAVRAARPSRLFAPALA